MTRKLFYLIILLLSTIKYSSAQHNHVHEMDKCGYDPVKDALMLELLGKNWGYGYDSLLNDIDLWGISDYVEVQSIGQSTLGREMYELTITNFDETKNLKHRIFIHARTHPGEIQSFWVTNEIINYLTADTEIGLFLRDHCIFHIIPMYNPDGVELEYPRENANGIDIESNWDAVVPEIEVMNLRDRFQELMFEENQVEVALNMHSAYECNRFFWVHHPNGTSGLYYELEEEFVESVRSHFFEGIDPFDSHVSWSGGNPGVYPESWWWTNYAEAVMALTYEDMNCASAGLFDRTAYALLYGISDYLGLGYVTSPERLTSDIQIKAYPNPFADRVSVAVNNMSAINAVYLTDISGRQIGNVISDMVNNTIVIQGNELSNGVYLLNIITGNQRKTIKLVKQ